MMSFVNAPQNFIVMLPAMKPVNIKIMSYYEEHYLKPDGPVADEAILVKISAMLYPIQ